MHGYSIAEFIEAGSADVLRVEEGALYPALAPAGIARAAGAEWGVSDNNRRAKYYRLTAAGRKRLAEESSSWERLSAAIARVMQTA